MNRRQFLQASSAAVLASGVMPGPAYAQTQQVHRLVAGYVLGSDVWSSLVAPLDDPLSIVPAESLASGDASLADTGATITFHGSGSAFEGIEDFGLYVRTTSGGNGATLPMHCAWSYTNHGVVNVSGSVTVTVPVAGDRELELTTALNTCGDSDRDIAPLCLQKRFSLGSRLGAPKLRTGVYLIGVTDDAHADWSRFELAERAVIDNDAFAVLGPDSIRWRDTATHPFVVAVVDYAESEEA